MTYTQDFALALGAGKAGLSDLCAQLVNTAGAGVGSAVTTGFTEIGSGCYLWHYASIPDAHRGGVKFYSAAASSVVLAFAAINPEDAENLDAKISTSVGSAALTAAGVDAILDEVVEGTLTLRQICRLLLAAFAGKAAGGGTTSVSFRDVADSKNRITLTVDSSGNRSAATLDGS